MATGTPQSAQSAQLLRQQLSTLEGRESHLWWVALFVGWVLGCGITALLAPDALWSTGHFFESRYLSRLLLASFVVLVGLFNLYMMEQRKLTKKLRSDAMRELLRANAAEAVSQIDDLTDTFNRRFLEKLLEKETSRAARTQSRLSLMMVDVDDFKAVNTRFGHQTGDRVLRELAVLLKSTFRASDFVVRYGGDEFVVVMTETGEGEADVAEARLRLTVEHWNQREVVPGWELHLSCGTVQFRGGMTATELIAIADDRMYQKKNAERDALTLA